MIEVFKTNVDTIVAPDLLAQLQHHFPSCKINFDLDDCDRILRIEGQDFCVTTIIELIAGSNYTCEVLP
jgi:hypothetical protein